MFPGSLFGWSSSEVSCLCKTGLVVQVVGVEGAQAAS